MAITGLKLNCSIDRCWTMVVEAPSGAYTQGQLTKVGDVIGVIVSAAASGVDTTLIFKAPQITVPSATVGTGGYTVGDTLYYDAANGVVTSVDNNVPCGVVIEQPATGATEVCMALDGLLDIND